MSDAPPARPSFLDDDDDDDSSDDDDYDPTKPDDGEGENEGDEDEAEAESKRGRRRKKRSREEKKRRKKKKRRRREAEDSDDEEEEEEDDDDDDDDDDDGDGKTRKERKKSRAAFIDDAAEDEDDPDGKGGDDEEEDDDDDEAENDYIRDGFVVDENDEEEEEARRRRARIRKKKRAEGALEDSDEDDDGSVGGGDSDSDGGEGSGGGGGGGGKGEKTRRLKKLRDVDVLDDEDLALIQEARGGGLGPDAADDADAEYLRRERADADAREAREAAKRRAGTVRAADADELRKGLFDDEAGEDDGDGDGGGDGAGRGGGASDREASRGKASAAARVVEKYDEDGMDDFIEDDIGDQDDIRAQDAEDRRRAEEGDQEGVSESQLAEASAIFGTDYLDFMEGEKATGGEDDDDDLFADDVDAGRRSKRFRERGTGVDLGVDDGELVVDDDDDEDLFGDSDDDDDDGGTGAEQRAEALRLKREKRRLARTERREEMQRKRLERRRAQLRRAFEPVQLVENFCTERDDLIRAKDVPERYFDRDDVDPASSAETEVGPLRSVATEIDADEEEAATAIMSRVPAITSEFFSPPAGMSAEDSEKRSKTILNSIVYALRLVKKEALEPDFIRRYRADIVTSTAVRDSLHQVVDADLEWNRLIAARSAVEGLLGKSSEAAAAHDDAGGSIEDTVAKLRNDLSEAQANLDESVKDEERLAAELEGVKGGAADNENDDHDDDDDDELFGDDDEEEEKVRH